LAEFGQLVSDPAIPFAAVSFRELWASWEVHRTDRPSWLTKHVRLLRARYDVAIG
jgi:hypothetical protein